MKESVSFSKETVEKTSMNFAQLRERGISMVQQLSGKLWTDYNAHDPGVTIIEQLCYALTDVAYRTNYPIKDILFGGRNTVDTANRNAIYIPSDIYSTHPVTVTDLRKLLVDRFDSIQNVWIKPMDTSGFEEKLVQTEMVEILPKFIFGKKQKQQENEDANLLKEVKIVLNSVRNLGEDIAEVRILKPMLIKLNLEVRIVGQSDFEDEIAKLFMDLFEFVYSPVKKYNLKELRDEKISISEIYSGPKLNNGFIKPESFKSRVTSISAQNLENLLSKRSQDCRCKIESIFFDSVHYDRIFAIDGSYFHLLDDAYSYEQVDPFSSLFNHLKVYIGEKIKELSAYNKLEIKRKFHELWAKKYRQYAIGDSKNSYFYSKCEGIDRSVGSYYSIQNHFPQIYGIGQEGLPESATSERRAQSKQLASYLLFFEQHLANHLSQIDELSSFFNVNYSELSKKTYFGQKISSVKNMEAIQPDTAFQTEAAVYFKAAPRKYVFAEIDKMNYQELSDRDKRVLLNRLLVEKVLFDDLIQSVSHQRIPEYFLYGSRKYCSYIRLLFKLNFKWLSDHVNEDFWKSAVLSFAMLTRNEAKYFTEIVFMESFQQHIQKMLAAQEKLTLFNQLSANLKQIKPHFKKDRKEFQEFLLLWEKVAMQGEASYFERQNRIFDHMIARFGEEFNALPWEVGLEMGLINDRKSFKNELLKQKSHFLSNLKELSAGSLKGAFYKMEHSNGKVHRIPAGLEAMINAKTGIPKRALINTSERNYTGDAEYYYLVDHILLSDFLKDRKQEFGFKLVDELDELIYENENWYDTETERDKAIQNYLKTVETDEKPELQKLAYLFDGSKDDNGRIRLESVEKIRAEGTEKYSKGIYGQHRLILRRKLKDGEIIRDEFFSGSAIIDEDFFNVSISIVLPQWLGRFKDERFKSYLEELIYERVPSHIKVAILWLTKGEMKNFEPYYLEWEHIKANSVDRDNVINKASFSVYKELMKLKKA